MPDKLQQIKRRMRSVESTKKITSAMKLVAAARLRRVTRSFEFTRENLGRVSAMLGAIACCHGTVSEAFFQEPQNGTPYCVVLSSSKGFCGSFNAEVNKEIQRYHQEHPNAAFCPAGSRGADYMEYNHLQMPFGREPILDEMRYQDCEDLADRLIGVFLDGTACAVDLITTHYLNSLYSKVVRIPLLPLDRSALLKAYGEHAVPEIETEGGEGAEAFSAYVMREYLAARLYAAAKESLVSELSARRTAMNSASDNASSMLSKLSLTYNRARQAAITNEIIEIISGSEAQKNSVGEIKR